MQKIGVRNDNQDMLCLFVEPWGTDHWMRPGESLVVTAEGDPTSWPFDVTVHPDGVSVIVNEHYVVEVFDHAGAPAPCGFQRPADW
ncbi:hypothetical protein ACFWBN_32250 [Streptomyces sp. NPDC059989]|uniref:hypothetical protein n=1 Tax=Streptomyces sp. NPDC059989 TaxID=3347026 RepID=UPI0036890A24